MIDPYEWLCLFDKRNEDNVICCYDEPPEARADDCTCQHCESGNDFLAMEIVRLKQELGELEC
tara:strand:- start:1018 stop:1206 length:189 start_codon:yes stop_codon:yes gene_type:complete